MFKSVKKLFTDKNSTIAFDLDRQCFEIDDHAKGQVWMLRILSISMLFFSLLGYFKSDNLNLFYLVLAIFFTSMLILGFVNHNTSATIPLDQIKSVSYRKSTTSATGSIRLNNKRRRVLYHYNLSQFDEQVELFKSHGIEIKEKSSWF
ncbi:hypothetical protein LY01_02640 [Nonlabens xylanidelens]|uniref:Uncharacterized protein n=1 Tax=Nonlabens xylanidelens TaxID=191564 RepID=A0A2S6IGL3_9FLAO|nr:hypothetical protein [Nonlabens xylanidelens]PPK93352.1 hypothetical protein LY01_02640 [Nonlabens xylanidelens]